MKKRIVIQFCVTAKEKRAIEKAAKKYGVSVSSWLKFRAFGERVANGCVEAVR